MDHIDLDDLDKLLGDEGDDLFDEEGEQYQQFLRVCGMGLCPSMLFDICSALGAATKAQTLHDAHAEITPQYLW
jgi:hypothetical protein